MGGEVDNLINCAFTALEDDLFPPRGYYARIDDVPIIFDSRCTHTVTPFITDFIGRITLVDKRMNG